ncbi:MAG: hypothetical protein COA70_03050 [Planctomycetota bacterium]|nr:MAG: hypothetical protein COA70_03050 [Planctomycetota bacterium]
MRCHREVLTGVALLICLTPSFAAQKKLAEGPSENAAEEAATVELVMAAGIAHLVGGQESIGKAEEKWEWPYEGVYREGGKIPLGYRVGGTSICAWALLDGLQASQDDVTGAATNAATNAAIERATRFVLAALDQPPMQPGFSGGYDVRNWGTIYALNFLLRLEALDATPTAQKDIVPARIQWLVDTLQSDAIPETGGWNYARRGGAGASAASSPFMTAPAILALWQADAQGYAINAAVVPLALKSLVAAKVANGVYAYTSAGGLSKMPGTIGRSPAVEVVLGLAGLSSEKDLRISVVNFLEQWPELEKRRAKTGTHKGDYGIAPYYFYYAHYYASLAIENLPVEQRPELRKRFRARLFSSMDMETLTFNDRVFDRSSHFGTAMSLLALQQQHLPLPAGPKD